MYQHLPFFGPQGIKIRQHHKISVQVRKIELPVPCSQRKRAISGASPGCEIFQNGNDLLLK